MVTGIGVAVVLAGLAMAVTGRPRVPASPGGSAVARRAGSAAGMGTALAGLPDLGETGGVQDGGRLRVFLGVLLDVFLDVV